MNKENKKFDAWRNRANKGMPELAHRVFALRNKFYTGCGYHYGLEYELGRCIARLNDFGMSTANYYHGDDAIFNQIAIKVIVESLYKQVGDIEKNLKNKSSESILQVKP